MTTLTLILQLLLPLAIGAAVARYIATAVQPLLLDICGAEARATFWMRICTVAVLLVPPALTLAFAGLGEDGDLGNVLRRTLLLAIVGTLIAVGAVARVLFRTVRIPSAAGAAAP
jgi:hypothetical protein